MTPNQSNQLDSTNNIMKETNIERKQLNMRMRKQQWC